jgi:asparagine synthase (glutamine-hydrolysing)
LTPIKNSRRIVHPSLVPDMLAAAERDRATAWEGEKATEAWIRVEHDMQENYMRRMICHAMDYIRMFCSVHQAFTSEKVVSYMWSLAPEARTDKIYYELFRLLDRKLYSLPWARTGVAPDGTLEKNQLLKKNYHEWSEWLRGSLRERIKPLFFSPGLCELNIVYSLGLKRLWKVFSTSSICHFENVVKLCSLELARQQFNILPSDRPTYCKEICRDELQRYIKRFIKL